MAGYFTTSSTFVALNPARFADTRSKGTAVAGPSFSTTRNSTKVGPIGTHVGNGEQIDIIVSGRGGVPLTDTGAVILNVTVAQSSSAGYVTVFPLDSEPPTASSVNFEKGRSVPNLVVAKLGRGGGVSIATSAHGAHVIVDVLGYFPGVSTAGSSMTWTSIGRDVMKMPLTYDRCWPIQYRINPAGAPSGWIDDVFTAVTKIQDATGLVFSYQGTTNEPPSQNRDPFNEELAQVLIAFTTPAVIPGLGGSVVGLGGSTSFLGVDAVSYLPEQFFTGQVYFDRLEAIPSGFGGSSFGTVALHELAHVVGLGHVTNEQEIMNSFVIERAGYFGSGDLQGLGVLYKTQSCPGSPATFLSALRVAGSEPRAGKALATNIDPSDIKVTHRTFD